MTISHIIFDLDGTLIDSAPAILAGFEAAFATCGRSPIVPLTSSLIGPPLMDTLATLAGADEPAVLSVLADGFKAHYDQSGYRQTKVFPDVEQMLRDLRRHHYCLYVATNKRLLPTTRILEFLGWHRYFDEVYALDSYQPALKSKVALLTQVIARKQLNTQSTVYIGDRDEDGVAATLAGIPFILARWGYDGMQANSWRTVDHPSALLEMLTYVRDGTPTIRQTSTAGRPTDQA